jgi:hypothetical protein
MYVGIVDIVHQYVHVEVTDEIVDHQTVYVDVVEGFCR